MLNLLAIWMIYNAGVTCNDTPSIDQFRQTVETNQLKVINDFDGQYAKDFVKSLETIVTTPQDDSDIEEAIVVLSPPVVFIATFKDGCGQFMYRVNYETYQAALKSTTARN